MNDWPAGLQCLVFYWVDKEVLGERTPTYVAKIRVRDASARRPVWSPEDRQS
jgi:hypothetical protein